MTLGDAFFKAQDAGLLLDAMAQSYSGRQLIWLQLNERTELFKQRQLMSAALKSVSRGLLETQQFSTHSKPTPTTDSSWQPVEQQLRQLYDTYNIGEQGKLIGQTIEWVRINTLWFERDHQSLTEFLSTNAATTTTGIN
jgi:hypothetical protein